MRREEERDRREEKREGYSPYIHQWSADEKVESLIKGSLDRNIYLFSFQKNFTLPSFFKGCCYCSLVLSESPHSEETAQKNPSCHMEFCQLIMPSLKPRFGKNPCCHSWGWFLSSARLGMLDYTTSSRNICPCNYRKNFSSAKGMDL